MNLLGFNFSKISIERLPSQSQDLKVVTNFAVPEIEEVKSDAFKIKDEILKAKFNYNINYEPDYAKLEFAGEIMISLEPKLFKDVMKEWKENKTINDDVKVFLFNIILKKSNIKAMELEDEMNLPSHIPLPSVTKDSIKSQKSE